MKYYNQIKIVNQRVIEINVLNINIELKSPMNFNIILKIIYQIIDLWIICSVLRMFMIVI